MSGPGDEVITVSHSFIATANAVRYCNATPVFVDVTADTFNIDPSLIEPAISDRTKAILVVHQLGMPCDLPPILTLARRRGIPVIEDAACAIGSELLWDGHWERVGKPHADIACFSFHPRKLLSTGDGGMLTTRDQKLDATFRLLRQHGMTVPDTVRHASSQVVFEEYSVPAFNYRMTDIQAAIGREQLKRLPAIVERRRDAGRRVCRVSPRHSRCDSGHRAGMGAHQLAKLHRSSRSRPSISGASCSAFWTRASPRGAV